HDVFTYVTSLPDPEAKEDTTSFRQQTIRTGDTIFYGKGFITVGAPRSLDSLPEQIFGKDGKVIELPAQIHRRSGESISLTLKAAYAKNQWLPLPDTLQAEGMILQLEQQININESIFYETNHFNTQKAHQPILNSIAKQLISNPSNSIEITSHTDDVGSVENNLILSKDRAENVSNYLIKLGVKASQLQVKGIGESKPLEPNSINGRDNPTGRAKNRRTEIKSNKWKIGIKESDSLLKYVTLKAFHYPYIQFLWFGIWLTAAGLLISTRRRMLQWLHDSRS
ncbi:MAG: OmpA family protein, partial [Bacteroidota bacterium]